MVRSYYCLIRIYMYNIVIDWSSLMQLSIYYKDLLAYAAPLYSTSL